MDGLSTIDMEKSLGGRLKITMYTKKKPTESLDAFSMQMHE